MLSEYIAYLLTTINCRLQRVPVLVLFMQGEKLILLSYTGKVWAGIN